jgi:DNA modification methylase
MDCIGQESGQGWQMYHGDACEVLRELPDESVGLSIFSPPFASLFSYSDSDRDLGNSRSYDEFWEHFGFIIRELYRLLAPGRSAAVHCMDLPKNINQDGIIGLRDFSGDVIRNFEAAGFVFHSRHVIWKDPLVAATRTKALGLAHKQIVKDSTMCRAGLPDFLVAMRKPGQNETPCAHPKGLTKFIGEADPEHDEDGRFTRWLNETDPRHARGVKVSHRIWRRYASPVWMDIDQGKTLNARAARADQDERHICPLQLDVIERALELWSTEGDIVLSPFAGVGSEGYVALDRGRKFIGVELKSSYYNQAVFNLKSIEAKDRASSLFDGSATESEAARDSRSPVSEGWPK